MSRTPTEIARAILASGPIARGRIDAGNGRNVTVNGLDAIRVARVVVAGAAGVSEITDEQCDEIADWIAAAPVLARAYLTAIPEPVAKTRALIAAGDKLLSRYERGNDGTSDDFGTVQGDDVRALVDALADARAALRRGEGV